MLARNEESSRSLTHRSTVARRQLHVSLGAVVVIALVAVAAAVGLRGSPTTDQTAAHVAKTPTIVKAGVRQLPSQRMQATDQGKTGRGI